MLASTSKRGTVDRLARASAMAVLHRSASSARPDNLEEPGGITIDARRAWATRRETIAAVSIPAPRGGSMDTRKLSRRQLMRTLGLGAGLTLIAPIVAACGQSGSSATSGGAPVSTAAPAKPPESKPAETNPAAPAATPPAAGQAAPAAP